MFTLYNYEIELFEEGEDSETIVFECMAENEAHAIEQVKDAYKGCLVDAIVKLN